MARIFGCAVDWTYDLFAEDMRRYKVPEGGFDSRMDSTDYRRYFATWLKSAAADFMAEWLRTHNGRQYDANDGWVGDAFARVTVNSDFFSDFYKDAYNQRPHLDAWYYVYALGLPQRTDTVRVFCSDPISDAEKRAREVRESA